jgi:hypothetical protein
METSLAETLASRVDRLELQNRILKRIVAGIGVALVATAMIGSGFGRHTRRVESGEFLLRDSTGKVRATLGFQDGEPALVMLDGKGREQIALRSNFDRSSTLDFSANGLLRLSLNSSSVGASALQMYDDEHSLVSALYAWPRAASGLALNRGRGGVHMGVQPDGTARLAFSDAQGRPRGGWELTAEEQAKLLAEDAEKSSASQRAIRTSSTLRTPRPASVIPVSDPMGPPARGGSSYVGTNTTLAP